MKDTEQIREAAEKYAEKWKQYASNHFEWISKAHIDGYQQALSDMKEGVGVIELREKWLSEDVSKMGSNNIFNWFIPYIHQPEQESDAETFNACIKWAIKNGFEHGYEGENVWYNEDDGIKLTNKKLFTKFKSQTQK